MILCCICKVGKSDAAFNRKQKKKITGNVCKVCCHKWHKQQGHADIKTWLEKHRTGKKNKPVFTQQPKKIKIIQLKPKQIQELNEKYKEFLKD